jgi:thiol:disulfide interchange protein DsbC
LHPNAEKVSNQIWCSKTLQKLGQIICLIANCQQWQKLYKPNSEKYCFRPEIKYRWHTNLFLQDGQRLSGVPSDAKQIEALLQSAK